MPERNIQERRERRGMEGTAKHQKTGNRIRAPFEPRPEGRGHVPNRRGSTYVRRRMWITFWSQFGGVFLGDFWEPTGPGAGVRWVFSADGVLLVRWASADLVPFSTFFAFLGRFLPVFVPYFALFSSMSCAYLYVNNFFSAPLAWNVRGGSPQRSQSTQRGILGKKNDEIRPVRQSPQGDGGRRARAVGGRRGNLAFDKETVFDDR
jgi:hypothetical protein